MERSPGVESSQKTILYIEDDPASRSLVERALSHLGYRVLVAERGLDGVDIARRELPDLILMDINLPDLSGREITTTLRRDKRFSTTPIVALTAQGYGEHRALAMAAPALIYAVWPQLTAQPRRLPRIVLVSLLLGLLGFLPYVYLPLRALAGIAALAVFGHIVAVAFTKHPLGLLGRLT